MPPAPLPKDEVRRLAALLSCGVLDTAPEADFDDLTELAAGLCDAPIALVSLLDRDRQWFKSRTGLDVEQTPRDQAFCGYAILSDEPLVITDATRDPRTADNPLVTEWPGIRFYAGVPLRLSCGAAVGTLCIIGLEPRTPDATTISHLKRLARQAAAQLELRATVARLEAATQAARAADTAKSAFLANMSHEIRTPMTAILGHADLLAEPDLAADLDHVARAVESIRRNGRHLLALINDVLDLSKIEAGRLTVERIPTTTLELIEEAIDIVAPAAAEKGLGLQVLGEAPIPEVITTDPTRLRQVLVNLLSNAVKFTDEGEVTVRLTVDLAAERLTIAVADTGIGMNEEQRRRIARFEPFSQADSSTTRTHGGTGLGLRISNLIAAELGDGLSVASTAGVGSTVTATIDTGSLDGVRLVDVARPPTPARLAAAKTVPERNGAPASSLAGRHVLLAEDGPDNRMLIRVLLERAGATVSMVENGREAVARLTRPDAGTAGDPPVDMVLMDVDMPEMDGFQATRALRAAGCRLPIVAVTAHAMAGDEQACLDAGCDGYLSKPIVGATLIGTCREVLDAGHRRHAA